MGVEISSLISPFLTCGPRGIRREAGNGRSDPAEGARDIALILCGVAPLVGTVEGKGLLRARGELGAVIVGPQGDDGHSEHDRDVLLRVQGVRLRPIAANVAGDYGRSLGEGGGGGGRKRNN